MESLGDQKNKVYGGQCQFKLWSALFNVDVVQLNSYFLQSFYNEVIFLTWVIQLRLTVYIFIISSIIYILICIGVNKGASWRHFQSAADSTDIPFITLELLLEVYHVYRWLLFF